MQSSGVVITYKVPHNGVLCVVSCERRDDIARCRLVFSLQPDPVSTHDIMGGDLNIEFLLHQLSDYNVGVFSLQPDPVSMHDIMGGDLNIEFLLHQLSDYNIGVCARFLWYPPNTYDVSAGKLLKLIARSPWYLVGFFAD